jgi:CBS domain-containing protein
MLPASSTSSGHLGAMTVADLMTRETVTVTPGTPFKEVVQALEAHHISAVPVVADGEIVGIVSEADLLPKEERMVRRFGPLLEGPKHRRSRVKAEGATAAEVMTTSVVAVSPQASVAEAARLMDRHTVKRLPVVEGGRLVGIVSRADLLRVFLIDDEEVRRRIVDGIVTGFPLLEPNDVDVTVSAGVVSLRGRLERRTDVDILERLVAAMEPVVRVDNALTYQLDDRKPLSEGGKRFERP